MKKNIRNKVVIASNNKDKVEEIKGYLSRISVKTIPSYELNIPEPEETEKTFKGNALLKASHTAKLTNLPSLGDDSGLVIPALNGKPGIFSARWGGPKKDFNLAMKKVNKKLMGKNNFAWFVCSIAIVFPNNRYNIFEGRVYGNLTWPPRGKYGFGYDPIFIPLGYKKTFGEMKKEFKENISHRSIAFNQFFEIIKFF
ncbi:MAG: Non-canonical purine NTP pyrophosphatase [Alphaproteobacteria bacterium MarineAlpha2_Bin1]|nr:MAG: Non-canonical purine NTP pyrophosphatase [Alphaproteobacteria bacterium MarineAlpha2_Bin1]|tara:strand:+ start:4547 stop:5140 length:594 start_codon:yes stop_codon:yes gene_type:complete